jgi:hypothetical protein
MSTVKSKKLQVGTDATASNNFTIYQPATPDGTLRIGVGNADSPTEVGRFTSAGLSVTGRVQSSNPVSLYAYLPTDTSISNTTVTLIPFSSIGYEYGGSNFNTSTYIYTVPVSGIYSVILNNEVNAANSIHAGIFVNAGGNASKGLADVWVQTGDSVVSGANHSITKSAILNLVAGDTLSFYVYHSSGVARNLINNRSYVNIHLLG